MAVAPTTLFSSAFSVIYNLLDDYVVDPIASTRNPTHGSTKWIFGAFPASDVIAEKIKYPILILDPIDASWDDWTLTRNQTDMTIGITIYSTNVEQLDEIFDEVNAVMDSQRPYLLTQGLHNIRLNSSSTDFVMHGGTRVHFKTVSYMARYYFTHGLAKKERSNTIASNAVIG